MDWVLAEDFSSVVLLNVEQGEITAVGLEKDQQLHPPVVFQSLHSLLRGVIPSRAFAGCLWLVAILASLCVCGGSGGRFRVPCCAVRRYQRVVGQKSSTRSRCEIDAPTICKQDSGSCLLSHSLQICSSLAFIQERCSASVFVSRRKGLI